MGVGRLSLSAAGLSATAGIFLAIFEVQEWKMPDELAAALVALVVIGGIIFLAVVAYEIAKLLAATIRRRGFRWPIYDKNAPLPYQWILDVAQEDAGNPIQGLLICGQTVSDMNLKPDEERPWIEFGLELFNVGIYGLTVGSVTGHAHYKGKELKEAAEGSIGKSVKPRWHRHTYKVKQYVTPEQAVDLYEEILAKRGVYSVSLAGVQLEVQSEAPGTRAHSMSLGSSDGFLYGKG